MQHVVVPVLSNSVGFGFEGNITSFFFLAFTN